MREVETKPVLTVVVLTYNQQRYIERCLRSVASQNTDVPFIIRVFDDFSDDGTGLVCHRLKTEFPNLIQYERRKKNLGPTANFLQALDGLSSEYVAFCEGDDFWLDEHKLAQQIKFLQQHPEYQAVCSDCLLVNEAGEGDSLFSRGRITEGKEQMDLGIKEVLTSTFRPIHISSLTMRSEIVSHCLPSWYLQSPILDTPFLFTLVARYRVRYFGRPTAAYRIHRESFTKAKGFPRSYWIRLKWMFERLNEDLEHEFDPWFRITINNRRIQHLVAEGSRGGPARKVWLSLGMLPTLLIPSSYSPRDILFLLRKEIWK